MTLDPHIQQLADVLVGICVRELTARRDGQEKARDLVDEVHGLKTLEQSNGISKTAFSPTRMQDLRRTD